ncbi:sulfurtransferase TusA family protein [Candidatus Thiosymbion oneisti]|uniref:sulfurtransferase TusA family protein n=1 Tax=Candidatus Thiosymbion oneisti TaxID=589554 RepID=UPI000B7E0929|nr:sulfurtransferase TusA family protein [Candidatus Thiosymbion oneisti]
MDTLDTVVVDCRRLLCPLPVIRVQDRVADLAPGTQVEAVCTDPGALQDIPAWCRINGHTVLRTDSKDGEHCVVMRVGGACE